MEPWQARVVRELAALSIKRAALDRFIDRAVFAALSPEDKALLRRQRDSMMQLAAILEARVSRF